MRLILDKAEDMKIEDIRNLKELIKYRQKGKRIKHLHFWGHKPKTPKIIDSSCLSQWYHAPFTLENIRFPTSEHYMMAQKAKLFNDSEMYKRILLAKSPGEAKRLGRLVKNFNNEEWEINGFEFVITGNKGKFSQNIELKKFLIMTGRKILVEASPRDRIWGIGMGKDNEHAEVPEKWRGTNLLGFALMEVRKQLMEQ